MRYDINHNFDLSKKRLTEQQSVKQAWAGCANRILDIVLGIVALIFFAPLMILVAAAIWISDGGPIFFRQERIGKCARPFSCWKFRSMFVDAETKLETLLANDSMSYAEWDANRKLTCDPRVTPLGRFLRQSSLDELPQLFNVLKGDMSLVGPRPIVFSEIGKYGRYFDKYCSVRPGITGLWQVSGRSDLEYRRRVALDVTYTRSPRFILNLKIMCLTISSVLFARGSR